MKDHDVSPDAPQDAQPDIAAEAPVETELTELAGALVAQMKRAERLGRGFFSGKPPKPLDARRVDSPRPSQDMNRQTRRPPGAQSSSAPGRRMPASRLETDGPRPAASSQNRMQDRVKGRMDDQVPNRHGAPKAGSGDVTGKLAAIDMAGAAGLLVVKTLLGRCERCPLHRSRRHIVFGEGDPDADVMFIAEAPGAEEDRQGAPFVGPAGNLLTRMVEAMGLRRKDIYIANILKCRPPSNRDPLPEEMEVCQPFLMAQIQAIQPRIIVALGRIAAQALLETDEPLSRLRGRFHDLRGVPLMPTYHPAYLLRNAAAKRPTWEDLKKIMSEMDRLGIKRNKNPPRA